MPIQPSTWVPGPLSPQQLNADLISFDGTGFTPNGVVFHAHRPVLYETIISNRALAAGTAGTWSTISGSGTTAFSVLDTSALFSPGSDNPGVYASCQFSPAVSAGGGVAGIIGGYTLCAAYLTAAAAQGTPAAVGAGVTVVAGTAASAFFSQGAIQPQGTAKSACAPWVDIINSASAPQTKTQTFTASGNWTAPAGVLSVQVQCWGAGGGGGGSRSGGSGGGGGGGGYALNTSYAVVPGVTYTLTVGTGGSGGSGGSSGQAGGNTIFDTTGAGVTATGGGGGGSDAAGGTSGSPGFFLGSVTLAFQGGSGGDTAGGAAFGGGGGGSAGPASNGNNGLENPGSGSTGAPAVAGGGPGGDGGVSGSGSAPVSGPGGGGGGVGTGPGTTGGNGFAGQMILTWLQLGNALFEWQPSEFVADASAGTRTPPANASDTAGITSRVMFAWSGVTSGGQTLTSVPTPQQTWPSITSTLLNGPTGPKQALTFLNNPPLIRVSQGLTSSISSGSNNVLAFGTTATVSPDTYSGWDLGASHYTAQLPGLYLMAPVIPFSSNATGQRYCGVAVNGTAVYQGPSYAPSLIPSGVTSVTQVRVLDLAANDTVTMFAFQDSGGALALNSSSSYTTRFIGAMLCPLTTGSGAITTAPPVTSFKWSAGLPASQLPALLNLHLGSDLSFLVNRPYFTGYQGTAQSGFANNTWNAVTIDTVGGLIHGSKGDNYAGWNAASNAYVAQQPGWYMVIVEVFATVPTTTTGYVTAGISVSGSGGIAPSVSPDSYQSAFHPLTTGAAPGASAIGLYYLIPGESVSPVIRADSWTAGTWGTTSSSAVRSQFTVVWLCE